jgi:tRNA (Thr-GGU) A37 N-methylase
MSSGIPTQALKAAEEAEKLYQEQIDVLAGTAPTGEIKPVEEAATGPTGEVEEVIEETPEQKAEKAQHKYDVLKGKYNREVPELAQRLAEQAGQIKLLTDQVTALTSGKKIEDTKEVLDSLEQDPNIAYLRAEYPEALKGMEALVKVAVADVSKKVEKISSEVAEQKKEVHKTVEDRYFDDLDTVKDWQVINKSEEFNEWLEEIEPLTGFKRRAILDDAASNLDSKRVKNFFSEFTGKKVRPVDTTGIVKVKEATGIAPRTTVTKTVVDRSELKENYIKATDVSKFYNDVRKGLYKGRDAERDKIEAEINKAISARRVIAGQ